MKESFPKFSRASFGCMNAFLPIAPRSIYTRVNTCKCGDGTFMSKTCNISNFETMLSSSTACLIVSSVRSSFGNTGTSIKFHLSEAEPAEKHFSKRYGAAESPISCCLRSRQKMDNYYLELRPGIWEIEYYVWRQSNRRKLPVINMTSTDAIYKTRVKSLFLSLSPSFVMEETYL